MTPEEQYRENLFETFATKGWKQVMESVNDSLATLDNVSSINNERDLYYVKGKIDAFQTLANLETAVRYEDKEEQERAIV